MPKQTLHRHLQKQNKQLKRHWYVTDHKTSKEHPFCLDIYYKGAWQKQCLSLTDAYSFLKKQNAIITVFQKPWFA